MKNVTWALLLLLFIYDIYCNENILSKFHQNVYKIKDLRVDLDSYNEKYFNIFTIRTFKYNRTTPAVNATVNFKVSVKDKIEVVIQVLKFLSNEFRYFPIRFQVNLKKAFDSNAIGLQRIKSCGNLTTFSFEKDVTYYTCNYVNDETHYPPLIPNGIFKAEATLLYLHEEIAVASAVAEVYTPISYPKK